MTEINCSICEAIADACLTYFEDDRCILYADITGPKIALKQHRCDASLATLTHMLAIVRNKTGYRALRLPKNTASQHFHLVVEDLG